MNLKGTSPFAFYPASHSTRASPGFWELLKSKPGRRKHHTPRHRIEIKLRDLNQLFNTMDPSPFHEKDLDDDAEEFIVSWAQEFHRHEPLGLVIHLGGEANPGGSQTVAEQAIHHYFAYKARLNRPDLPEIEPHAGRNPFFNLSPIISCKLSPRESSPIRS